MIHYSPIFNSGTLKYATNRKSFLLSVGLICIMMLEPRAYSLPGGNQVTSGTAAFVQSGNVLTIKQSSDKLITKWKSFSIGAAETTQFIQPNSKSAALNRVTGGAASLIDGKLIANGQVVLINPAGIAIGAKGVINVNHFTASTQDLTDADFLNGGEDLFSGTSQAGIRNLGTIQASGGDAILIAKTINNDGKIFAPNGTIGLAAGTQVLIKPAGEERIYIKPASAKGGTISQGLTGSIQAASAEVKAAGNPYATAINLSGLIQTTGSTTATPKILVQSGNGNLQINADAKLIARSAAGKGGRISLNADASGKSAYPLDSSDYVNVTVAGSLDTVGSGFAQLGGAISVFGDVIQLRPESRLDVSGSGDAGLIHLQALTQLQVGSGTGTGGLWANSALGNGGTINLLADVDGSVIVQSTARISASLNGTGIKQAGRSGGTIRIGGGFGGEEAGIVNAGKTAILSGAQIASNGGTWGNGGRISVWSDTAADVYGNFEAKGGTQLGNGGFVEISAKHLLDYSGLTNTTAPFGTTGMLLIDPDNIIIKSALNLAYTPLLGTSVITVETLKLQLALTNVTVETDATVVGNTEIFTGSSAIFGEKQNGKIAVIDDIVWTAGLGGATSLTLDAQGSILLLGSIANLSGGDVILHADTNNQLGGDVFIGSGSQTKGVSVESLRDIRVIGENIHLLGSNTTANGFARIGNGGFTKLIGRDISLTANAGNAVVPAIGALAGKTNLGAINLLAGTQTGSFAQVGHGGKGLVMSTQAGASVHSNLSLSAAAGAINAVASSADAGYVQIGHGGYRTTLNGSPSTTVLTLNLNVSAQKFSLIGGTGEGAYAQLGHGGFYSRLNLRNKLIADTTVTLTGTNGRVLDVDAGFGQSSATQGGYAQIGLGGTGADFNVLSQSAFIQITANGANATLRVHNGVSDDTMSYSQIGHGGYWSTYGSSASGLNLYDPAKNTVFSSAPISISAVNVNLEVVNDNPPPSGSSQYARIGHGQTFSPNIFNANVNDPTLVELSYGNINVTINARKVLVQSLGGDARIGHGASDLAHLGHLSLSSTISIQATGTAPDSFVVDGPLALIGTAMDGTEWDGFTTTKGIDSTRKFLLNLSSNVTSKNGGYAADGVNYLNYIP